MTKKPPRGLQPVSGLTPLPVPHWVGAKAQKGRARMSAYKRLPSKPQPQKLQMPLSYRQLLPPPNPSYKAFACLCSQELGGYLGTVALSHPCICSYGFIPSSMETRPCQETVDISFLPNRGSMAPSPTGSRSGEAHVVPQCSGLYPILFCPALGSC